MAKITVTAYKLHPQNYTLEPQRGKTNLKLFSATP